VGTALPASHAMPRTLVTPEDWGGTWHGTYICGQGLTGVDLTITPAGDDSVTAIFSFYAVPENPSVPTGAVSMTGVLWSAGHLSWILQPSGWVLGWMEGDYDPETGNYEGQFFGRHCSRFRVRRDQVS
jgi:hypothetical protein